ncbi:hypothetical protein [Halocynthiibacter sp.]|uniref:hypothetical protein n=1 Tax=Halocynthiibacter sp. TaxID=1979210 RepID=UPI003C4C3624
MEFPIEVTLKRPVKLGDETHSILLFDEPDLDAQLAYAELEASFAKPPTVIDAGRVTRFWIARLADVSDKVVGKIKGSDLDVINEVLEKVLGFASGADEDGISDDPISGDEPSGNEPPAK